MKYKNIVIENFRGIKNCELNNLSRINLLLGQNNSGKSSILEAIFLLTGFYNPQAILNIDAIRGVQHNEEDDFRFIFFNLNYDFNLILKADMYEKSGKRILKISPDIKTNKIKNNELLSTSTGSLATQNGNSESISTTSQNSKNIIINKIIFDAEIKEQHEQRKKYSSSISFNRNSNGWEFKMDNDSQKPESFSGLLHSARVVNPTEIGKRLEKFIIEKRKNELLNGLKQIDTDVNDINVFTNSMIFVDIGAQHMIPANLMGDGFLKYLNIILGMNQVIGGVMLIDEIDNGLHFSTLKKLWKIILTSARQYNIQLFITTHSIEALTYLRDLLQEDEMTDYQKDVKFYTISKLLDKTVKAYEYDYDSFEYAINNEVEIRGEF